jgi:hypothetical protein
MILKDQIDLIQNVSFSTLIKLLLLNSALPGTID